MMIATSFYDRCLLVVSSLAVLFLVAVSKEAECLSATLPRIRALRQISSEPLAFTIDDFCDASTCAGLLQNSDEARLHFATLIAGELFAGQWGQYDGLRLNLSHSSDRNNQVGRGQCAEGLHIDVNNGSIFRSVTAILYLNDVPENFGGGTVFPLVDAKSNDPRLHASRRLLEEEIHHTRGSAVPTASNSGNKERDNDDGSRHSMLTAQQQTDAAVLESKISTAATGEGLRVQPQTGRLLLFFSRTDDGEIDPYAWHGGEKLIEHTVVSTAPSSAGIIEKKIITLFKEVSYGTDVERPLSFAADGDDTFEQYLSTQIAEQRCFLKALAETHAPFFQ